MIIIGTKKKAARRRIILKKTNGRCAHCGNMQHGNTTIDHFIPQSEGGTNDIRNLMPLCRKCNESRGSEDIDPATFYIYANHKAIKDCFAYSKFFYREKEYY